MERSKKTTALQKANLRGFAHTFDELRKEQVRKYLVENDERLCVKKVSIKKERSEIEKLIGAGIPPKVFKSLREECCHFWKKVAMRQSTLISLDEKQWSAIRVWGESNATRLAGVSTLEMAAALAMQDRVQCSAGLLSNSSSFMSIWNKTRTH